MLTVGAMLSSRATTGPGLDIAPTRPFLAPISDAPLTGGGWPTQCHRDEGYIPTFPALEPSNSRFDLSHCIISKGLEHQVDPFPIDFRGAVEKSPSLP